MSMMRRGQSSFEFAILIGFLVLVFMGFFLAVQFRSSEQQSINRELRYGQLVNIVEQELLLASSVKTGYYRQFFSPLYLGSEAYVLSWSDDDTLVLRGSASQNEYIRFLTVKAFLIQALNLSPGVENPFCPISSSLVCCPYIGNGFICDTPPKIVLTTDENGLLLIRKDCAWQECGSTPCGDVGSCPAGQICENNFCGDCGDDSDEDGYPSLAYCGAPQDCDDNNASIHPGATEYPSDGVDQNCDDEELCYRDYDGDSFRPDATSTIVSADLDCTDAHEASALLPIGDCDDNNSSIYPGAAESCNEKDDDCDGETDEGVKSTFYYDSDGDTYGNTSRTAEACNAPTGYVAANDDCNDADATIHPGATELCDGKDNDCDATVDEGCDDDNDDYCDAAMTRASSYSCSGTNNCCPSGGNDCNDTNSTIKPDATTDTTCNDIDENCDGFDTCCTDTDGGIYPFIFGTTMNTTQTLSDTCVVMTKAFTEYSCVGSRILLTTNSCTNSSYGGTPSSVCFNGRCCTPTNSLCDRGSEPDYECGDVADGCGGSISCGTCSFPGKCFNHQCSPSGGGACIPPCGANYVCESSNCVTYVDFCDRRPDLCSGGTPNNS